MGSGHTVGFVSRKQGGAYHCSAPAVSSPWEASTPRTDLSSWGNLFWRCHRVCQRCASLMPSVFLNLVKLIVGIDLQCGRTAAIQGYLQGESSLGPHCWPAAYVVQHLRRGYSLCYHKILHSGEAREDSDPAISLERHLVRDLSVHRFSWTHSSLLVSVP